MNNPADKANKALGFSTSMKGVSANASGSQGTKVVSNPTTRSKAKEAAKDLGIKVNPKASTKQIQYAVAVAAERNKGFQQAVAEAAKKNPDFHAELGKMIKEAVADINKGVPAGVVIGGATDPKVVSNRTQDPSSKPQNDPARRATESKFMIPFYAYNSTTGKVGIINLTAETGFAPLVT